MVGKFIEKHYDFSLKKAFLLSDALKPYANQFYTSNIAKAIPDYKRYNGASFDIISTLSESFLKISDYENKMSMYGSYDEEEEQDEEELNDDDVIGMNIKTNGDMELRVNMNAVMNLVKND